MTSLPASPATRPWASETVQRRISSIASALPLTDPEALSQVLLDAARATNERMQTGVNLYAGSNLLSPLAVRTAAPELGSRPTLGDPGEKFPSGVELLDQIEIAATETVRALVGAAFADVRPFSATMANLAVMCVLAKPGDTIAATPIPAGGHVSHHSGAPRVRGLNVEPFPYDYPSFGVDLERLPGFLERVRPRLLVVGGNIMLKPLDLGGLLPITQKYGVPVLYDASHVAGLIAGGHFQDPLSAGVDVLTFSTYKSFGGPAGGAVCTNDPGLAQQISDTIYPALSANYDVHRLAPLAVVASEHLRSAAAYGRECIANARALGAALSEHGIPLLGESFGFTESHHLAVDVRGLGGGPEASRLLAAAGIYSSPALLPLGDDAFAEDGLRLGTQEITRRGVQGGELTEIADLIAGLLHGELEPVATKKRVADIWR